jgi:hypothetical protein
VEPPLLIEEDDRSINDDERRQISAAVKLRGSMNTESQDHRAIPVFHTRFMPHQSLRLVLDPSWPFSSSSHFPRL